MSAATPAPQAAKRGMGKIVAVVIVVIIIVAAVGLYYVYYGMSKPATSTINIASGTGSNQALNFNPSSITVVIGKNNTIQFTNSDSTTHTVTFTGAPSGVSLSTISDSGLSAGTSFTITLTTAGTYQYHCSIHSWMSGTITVVSG
ncbi:MAG TPA: plastocyanin/azurin family copper-binding protein [Nitrososphaerales archaeon]|nr:plastocyanin/azurin family copper-binding protein [Nitrososphaerales archaeon]